MGQPQLHGNIDDNDRAAADAAKAKLQISNLYEDAYFGLGEYLYAARWGHETQKIEGLRRAIAAESTAHYLPRATFAVALQALLPLEINSHDFANAMITWERMQNAGIDKKRLAEFKPMIDTIEKMQTDAEAYAVSGQIVESTWSLALFKSHFQFEVSEGRLSTVKLLCEKKFVVFSFDPDLDYRIPASFGKCRLAVGGEAGTKFKLIQH